MLQKNTTYFFKTIVMIESKRLRFAKTTTNTIIGGLDIFKVDNVSSKKETS